jgi:hypothetical protein
MKDKMAIEEQKALEILAQMPELQHFDIRFLPEE